MAQFRFGLRFGVVLLAIKRGRAGGSPSAIMSKKNKVKKSGAGELVSIASAIMAAGVSISPARRAFGLESMTMSQALASCETPAGDILRACQAAADVTGAGRDASKLNSKMVHDGRAALWDGGGDCWLATMRDAVGDGVAAVQLWRAGSSMVRDGESGGDVITLGDSLGGVSFAFVRSSWARAWAGVAGESTAQAVAGYVGGRAAASVSTCKLLVTGRRVSWRALVASVARDTYGETPAGAALVRDWVAWWQAWGAGVTAADLITSWQVERARARRLSRVESMHDKLAAGRGRRAALAGKVKQAAVLMLAGVSSDEAAAAAGFKANQAGGRGRASSGDRLTAALRRAGLRVTARRGAWADDYADEGERAAKRGGASADLVRVYDGGDLSSYAPSSGIDDKPTAAAWVIASSRAATVCGLHPLAGAESGKQARASARVAVPTLARAVSLRPAAAAFRRLSGLVRRPALRRPASGVAAAAAASVALSARVAALVTEDERGAWLVQSTRAARVVAGDKRAAAVVVAGESLGAVRLVRRRFICGAAGVTVDNGQRNSGFNLRAVWDGVRLVRWVAVAAAS